VTWPSDATKRVDAKLGGATKDGVGVSRRGSSRRIRASVRRCRLCLSGHLRNKDRRDKGGGGARQEQHRHGAHTPSFKLTDARRACSLAHEANRALVMMMLTAIASSTAAIAPDHGGDVRPIDDDRDLGPAAE
jgi:hypothetical protein